MLEALTVASLVDYISEKGGDVRTFYVVDSRVTVCSVAKQSFRKHPEVVARPQLI